MTLFRRMFSRNRMSVDLSEEMQQHLEEKIEALVAGGMSREEAVHAARRAFGNATLIEQRSREVWMWPLVESIWADIKFALRQLRKSPGFTAAVVPTLALGIGACTMVFAVVYGALIDPYPYRDANRIVQMAFRNKQEIRGFMAVNTSDFETVRRNALVADAMLTGFADPITTVNGYAEDVQAALLSGNGFGFLGVAPLFGRTLTAHDENRSVVVLGYEFCRNHYHCDAGVLGRTLDFDHRLYTIVGVMPRRFDWENAAVFLPLPESKSSDDAYPLYLRAKAGVASGDLSEAMLSLVRRFVLASDGVMLPVDTRLTVEPLSERRGSTTQKRLEVLLASVLLLLLIACSNASILMLGRAATREHEFGIRLAMGAGRGRILRQLLTEAMMVAFCGGALGIGFAYGGIALLRVPLVKSFFPAGAVLSVNAQVLACSTLSSVITGLLFGILPGLEISGSLPSRPRIALPAAGATRRHRSYRPLIFAQVSLTLILMMTAVTAIRAFVRLYQLDLGYDPHHVLSFRLPIPGGQYATWGQRVQYYTALRERLQAIPGIISTSVDEAMATGGGMHMEYGLPTTAWGADMDMKMPRADFEFVDPQYLATMRIPIFAGRSFTQGEYSDGQNVALINRSFARRLFGPENPIGQVLRLPPLLAGYPGIMRPPHPNGYVRIIGVTGDQLAAWNPGAPPRETLYLPASLFAGTGNVRAQLRTVGDPMSLLQTARRAVEKLNASQPVSEPRTLDDILSEDLRGRDRWLAIIFGAFAGVSLSLAAVGLYSVVSFGVTQRKREIGLRMALGASRKDILWATLFSEMRVVLAGICVGFVANAAAQKLLKDFLTAPSGDAWMLALCTATMVSVAMLAAYFPSRRASSVDPMEALRAE